MFHSMNRDDLKVWEIFDYLAEYGLMPDQTEATSQEWVAAVFTMIQKGIITIPDYLQLDPLINERYTAIGGYE